MRSAGAGGAEHAAGGHAGEGVHELDGVAAGHADDAPVGLIDIASRDVVAQRRLAGDGSRRARRAPRSCPQRLERGIVDVPPVDGVGVADHRHRRLLSHGPARLLGGQDGIVERHLRGELHPRRVVGAEVARPVVVRARQRRDFRLQVVVHQHLAAPRAVDDGHVDALDVHGLHVRLGVVAPGVCDRVVRMALERPRLLILADHGGARALGHLRDGQIADLDDRLVRCVLRPAREARGELLERRLEVFLPETVRLHRVQVAVHGPESALGHHALLACAARGRGRRLTETGG